FDLVSEKIKLLDAEFFTRERKFYIVLVVREFLKDPTDGQKIIGQWLNYTTEPILTAKELKTPCRRILTPSEREDLCKFYFEAIGRDLTPLKLLCRNKIVNLLGENGNLRNGISTLPLPPIMQSFLSLAADFVVSNPRCTLENK
ncbi:hypothetical protein AVEN_5865-1, partial [Araneus ventricosus]